MSTRMLERRGTAAAWAAANPILGAGEIGFETDTKRFKIGDGVTAWTALEEDYVRKTIVDAAGDLIVGTGPDSYDRLPVGAPGQHLTVDSGGVLVWSTPDVVVPPVPIDIIDTLGDLIVGLGPDDVDRLPSGTFGQLLRTNVDGSLVWSDDITHVWAAAYSSVLQTIPNATWTVLAYNTEISDSYTMHSNTPSPGQFVVPKTGYYEIHAHNMWDNVATGRRLMKFQINGTTNVPGAQDEIASATGAFPANKLTNRVHANAGDYFTALAWQSTGANLDTVAGFTYMQVQFLGA